jgi:hypothetical protein
MKIIALQVLSLALTSALQISADNAPVLLRQIPSKVGASTGSTLELVNTSDKEVIAFVLNSKVGGLSNSLEGILGQAPNSPRLMPGNSITVPNGARSPKPTPTPNFTIDLVLFADGSVWGPDVHKKADYIRGKIDGAALERKRQAAQKQ